MSGDFWRVVAAVVAREITAELRGRETLTALGAFALVVLVIFGFALNPVAVDLEPVFAGVYWLALAFAGLVAVGRSFAREKEAGTLESVAALPADAGAVYTAKVLVTTLWLVLVALLLTPLFFVLLDVPAPPSWGGWALTTLAGIAGLVCVGVLISALAVHARGADLLLPLLLLPLQVPVLLAAVRLGEALLAGEPLSALVGWCRLLVGYDIVFFVVSLVLFDYLAEV
ncbi:MAG TPA: heme exporter protein CcmB [Bacillota bacterium]